MKTLIAFVSFLLFFSIQTTARTVDDILKQPEQKSGIYRLTSSYLEAAVINMAFGTPEIGAVMNRSELRDAYIIRIDLVFTNYPKNIDMENLNRQRILKSIGIRSDLVKDENIEWRLVRQMYCNNEAEAKLLFHGVVIYYLPPQTAALNGIELDRYNSLPKDDTKKVTEKDLKQFPDSVVVAAFRRNKWKNPTIVADVTCSMYPYIAQTTLWYLLKLNKKEETNIVLFNDGDGIPNERKRIGKTGGIYSVTTKTYDNYRNLLIDAVSKGCSGDTDENDVEALLKAQELYPKAKEIILIADNFSNMRDYELIKKLKIPVRVILCGTQFGINVQYLELAWKTGGSVHTIEADLKSLVEKSEGDKFKFRGVTYLIKDGRIQPYPGTTNARTTRI